MTLQDATSLQYDPDDAEKELQIKYLQMRLHEGPSAISKSSGRCCHTRACHIILASNSKAFKVTKKLGTARDQSFLPSCG